MTKHHTSTPPTPSFFEGVVAFLYFLRYNLIMSIIQQIFSDHFNDVIDSGISIRPAVFDNVNKMLHCGDYKFGYTLFSCNHCGKFFLSLVKADSVILAAICILLNALLPCLLNLFVLHIGIAFYYS